MSERYLLDTNVFNHVLDGQIPLSAFEGKMLLATHIQRDELEQTPDDSRRAELLAVFDQVSPDVALTESIVWDVSRWDQGKWSGSDGVSIYEDLFERIKALDLDSKKERDAINQARDALTAETAIKQGLILITNDRNLTTAARERGCNVMDVKIPR